MHIALVVSQYHASITGRLETGARAALVDAGLSAEAIATFQVPGAYELAQAAQRVAESGAFAAVVCLGCVIRGETPHFEYIAQAAAHGITQAAQQTGVPVTFGVLTTHTVEEALARAVEGEGNKGREAALAALAMARLYAALDERTAARGRTP